MSSALGPVVRSHHIVARTHHVVVHAKASHFQLLRGKLLALLFHAVSMVELLLTLSMSTSETSSVVGLLLLSLLGLLLLLFQCILVDDLTIEVVGIPGTITTRADPIISSHGGNAGFYFRVALAAILQAISILQVDVAHVATKDGRERQTA